MLEIEIARTAQKEFLHYNAKDQKIITQKILNLESGSLVGVKKLVTQENIFRIRAGNFRIIFEKLPGNILKIARIRRRNEKTYR